MDSKALLFEEDGGVAVITLNRPEKSNGFNNEMIEALADALKRAEREASIRCLVITGAGKNFCAGQDLGAMLERAQGKGGLDFREHLQNGYNKIISRMRALDKPVLAAVNGAAAGAGLGLACACDIRYAAEGAKFRMAFIGIGLAPDSGTSYHLPRLIGYGRALEMAMTNELVDAAAALQYGLVSRVLPGEQLLPKTLELAKSLAQAPTRALGLTKRAFARSLASDLDQALEYEAYLQQVAGSTIDHQEGVAAFLAKRAPTYQGK